MHVYIYIYITCLKGPASSHVTSTDAAAGYESKPTSTSRQADVGTPVNVATDHAAVREVFGCTYLQVHTVPSLN